MGNMELGNRSRLLKDSQGLDWYKIDYSAFDSVCRDTEPRTEYAGVSRCIVMLMLPHVGGELRVHDPAESHEPER